MSNVSSRLLSNVIAVGRAEASLRAVCKDDEEFQSAKSIAIHKSRTEGVTYEAALGEQQAKLILGRGVAHEH